MSRAQRFPDYPGKAHSTGQARIRLGDKIIYLGKFRSKASYTKYTRLHTDWKAGRLETKSTTSGVVRLVRDVVGRYLLYRENEVESRASSQTELTQYRYLAKPLLRKFGETPVDQFGPRCLKALQEAMATGSWLTEEEVVAMKKRGLDGRWCRRRVNHMANRVKTLFRWAESEELVPPGTTAALRTVSGLRPGQHGAADRPPVHPVAEETLTKTLQHMNPVAAALVELLTLTGARPGELLGLTPRDINKTGEVEVARGVKLQLGSIWTANPPHKNSWRGHSRILLIGPKAQAILAPLLEGRPDDEPLFQPIEGEKSRREKQRAARATKVQPSQKDRRKAEVKKKPGKLYTCDSLRRAIVYACEKASVQQWTTYQCRHLAATRLAAEFGADIARIVLGHRDLGITRIYVADDLKSAADAMKKAG